MWWVAARRNVLSDGNAFTFFKKHLKPSQIFAMKAISYEIHTILSGCD